MTLTHGYAAGGNGDVVSRTVGDALGKRLGQPVVVEPRPVRAGLSEAEAAERLRKIGLDVQASTPEAMQAMVGGQIAKWKKVVAEAGIPQQ